MICSSSSAEDGPCSYNPGEIFSEESTLLQERKFGRDTLTKREWRHIQPYILVGPLKL